MFPQGYTVPNLFRLELDAKIRYSPDYMTAVDTDITDEFYGHSMDRILGTGNNVFCFKGIPGSAKSWSGLFLAEQKFSKWSGVGFTADNVHFSRTSVLESLKKYRKKMTIMLDEMTTSFGIGSYREDAEMVNILETCRKFQINFIFCSPRVHIQSHHGIIECWGIIHPELRQSIGLYSMEENCPRGYVAFGKPSKKLLEAYEKKKDAYITHMLRSQGGERFKSSEKVSKKLAEDDVFRNLKSVGMRILFIQKKFPELRNRTTAELKAMAQLAQLEIAMGEENNGGKTSKKKKAKRRN